jgi:hypothetical protein
MDFKSAWSVSGILVEKRELKSQKNATWRGYLWKIQTAGHMAELQVSEQQFALKGFDEGAGVVTQGRFEDSQNGLRLVMTGASLQKAGA